MADLANIAQLTHHFIDLAETSDKFNDRDMHLFDSVSGYYRIACERTDEMVINDFGDFVSAYHAQRDNAEIVMDVLEGYPDIQLLVAVDDAQSELGIGPRHRREVLNYYSDWAYRYGSKRKETVEHPEFSVRKQDEPMATIYAQAEDLYESGDATVNDLCLVFRLVDEYFDETKDGSVDADAMMGFYDRVYDEVDAMVETKSPDINWDLMGGMFKIGRDMADRDCMKEVGRRQGRREVIDELEATDLSLDEWMSEQA